jgi:arsenate reductase (thioredoxin)
MSERPDVLFVCIHNAGRSQMAAALLDHYCGDSVVVRSAGTAPADTINPTVVTAMREIGIDLDTTKAIPKQLTDATVATSDVVVTMGCGDTCRTGPASATSPGSLTTRPAHRSRSCEPSATRSTNKFEHSSLSYTDSAACADWRDDASTGTSRRTRYLLAADRGYSKPLVAVAGSSPSR